MTKVDALTLIRRLGASLTRRQLEVLQIMADNEHDDYEGTIIYERGVAYIGGTRIARRTVFALLRACAISPIFDYVDKSVEYYSINETGENILLKSQ